ncbi:MAG: TIM barrel protein [Acidobacteria bacterium]|nr:TIM barrel protein [Acidobacteriota bacterium]
MNRRSFVTTAVAAGGAGLLAQSARRQGRLKQGVARWCFAKWSIEELAQECARLGMKGIDLIGEKDWPVVQKHGLVPSIVSGGGGIADGLNRKENHDKIEQQMKENLSRAAAAGLPNVITFSGNRRGLSDEEGLENCVVGLNRVKALAEEKGVTICLELLNSKVNHKDYQADHTAWAVEVVKRVNSPRVKLLYDIYHMQIMEGDIIRTIRENIQYIGHFHTGGNPGRNEIDETQELNYRAIAQAVADLNFTGYFVHEFVPAGDPKRALERAVEICTV